MTPEDGGAAGGWIAHDSAPCPVSDETRVIVRLASGVQFTISDPAKFWKADKRGDPFDYWLGRGGFSEERKRKNDRIIAYRVVQP